MGRRSKGEGSVYFDQERRRWMGQADAGVNPRTGRRRRVKVVGGQGESKSAVAARLRARIDDLAATAEGNPTTVAELVGRWRARGAPKRQSSTTLAMTDSLIRNHVIPVLGKMAVSTVTAEQIEAFLDARAGDLSKSTIIKLRSILAQAFDWGIRRRHANWNPARVAELPPGLEVRREGRALSATEARALLNVADDHRLGAWVGVAITMGLRPGEASGLTWEAIDFDRRTLAVYQSLGWPDHGPVLKATKSRRSRILDMPAITAETLRAHRVRSAEERLLMSGTWPARWASLLFVSEAGTPLDPSNVRRLVAGLAAEAGIEGHLTPYDLRHSATSLMSAAGLSAERLADLLGHKDTRMVFNHYRHPVTSTVSTAAEYWGRGAYQGAYRSENESQRFRAESRDQDRKTR